MATGKIYVGTYGQALTIDTKISLSGNTALELHVKKPKTGTEVEWTCTASGTNLLYTASSGDWNEAGNYVCAAYVTFSGKVYIGERFIIKVWDKWEG